MICHTRGGGGTATSILLRLLPLLLCSSCMIPPAPISNVYVQHPREQLPEQVDIRLDRVDVRSFGDDDGLADIVRNTYQQLLLDYQQQHNTGNRIGTLSKSVAANPSADASWQIDLFLREKRIERRFKFRYSTSVLLLLTNGSREIARALTIIESKQSILSGHTLYRIARRSLQVLWREL